MTNLVSNLIGAQSDSLADITTLQGSPAESVAEDEASEAADAIARAVMQLAAAAAVGSGNELVELQSANLNLTTEAREPLELSARPVVCNTADEPVEVQMPASILQAAPGADALLPVSVVLYTTATSLHSTAGSIDGRTSSNRSLSQSVSFSLMQVRDIPVTLGLTSSLGPSAASAGRRRAEHLGRRAAHQHQRALPSGADQR